MVATIIPAETVVPALTPALPRDLLGAPREAAPVSAGPGRPRDPCGPPVLGSKLSSWAQMILLSFSAAVCKAHSVTAFSQIRSSVSRHRQAAQGHMAVESGVWGPTWPLPPGPPGRGQATRPRELILRYLCHWDNRRTTGSMGQVPPKRSENRLCKGARHSGLAVQGTVTCHGDRVSGNGRAFSTAC